MTATEAAIYQLKKLKGKPLKEKLDHIFTYFKVPIFVALFFIVFTVSMIVHVVTQKDLALSVYCLNSPTLDDAPDVFANEFAQAAQIDLDENEVIVYTNMIVDDSDAQGAYETAQVIMAKMSAQLVDILATDTRTMTQYAYGETFLDLTQVLTPEQLEKLEDQLVYYDAGFENPSVMDETPVIYPDPEDLESMKQPVPFAILIPVESRFSQACFPLYKNPVALGVVANTANLDNVKSFLNFILE